MSRRLHLACMVAAATLAAAAHGGAIVFVDADAPPGGDGAGWPTAYRFLQDALAAVAEPASGITEVRVAQGSYHPDRSEAAPDGSEDRLATFQLSDGVALLGGFAGLGAADPDQRDIEQFETILSGEIADPALAADNSIHVVTGTSTDRSALIEGFTITGGNADGSGEESRGGGMICAPGMPTVVSCSFTANAAALSGGGLYVSTLDPLVVDCTFSANTAWSGAGVALVQSDALLAGCTITGNVAHGGGGVSLAQGSPVLANCQITFNEAQFSGGGVTVASVSAVFTGCTFANNLAGDSGGGILHDSGTLSLTDCTFLGNSATDGGGLFSDIADATVNDCLFEANSAVFSGGGVFNLATHSTFTNCSFTGNVATLGTGGAMSNEGNGPILRQCTFTANQTGYRGGGVYNDGCPTVALVQCAFIANVAGGQLSSGGGLYNAFSDATVINCVFSGNTATGWAGGVQNLLSSPLMINCAFSGNHAEKLGGGLYNISDSNAMVFNCTFSGNTAGQLGGGVYDWASSPQLVNCILWGNADGSGGVLTAQLFDDGQSFAAVSYSLLEGLDGTLPGEGNIGDEPLFVDADGPDDTPGTADDDLRLLPGSPGIDAGDSTIDLVCLLDLAGGIRLVDDPRTPDSGVGGPPVVDMGAFEFGSPVPPNCNGNASDNLCEPDCNGNGIPDDCDIGEGVSPDCNGNGVPDECDIGEGVSADCNGNGVPDECDLAAGTSPDCNGNGVPDECDIAGGLSPDCNGNGIPDECDLAGGVSPDCNGNGIPDECDIAAGSSPDCNANGIPDECDFTGGMSPDCNGNGIPDECDLAAGSSQDCNANGVPDQCDISTVFIAASEALSPIGAGAPQTLTLLSPPAAAGEWVTLTLTAVADLGSEFEEILVDIHGATIGVIFGPDGSDCPVEPDVAQVLVDVELYNLLRTALGPNMPITATGSPSVSQAACDGASFITIEVEYEVTPLSGDLNGSGIPDECEAAGDLDGDGVVGINDLLLLLGAWGPCGEPCPPACTGDLGGDCLVGIEDFLELLGNWS